MIRRQARTMAFPSSAVATSFSFKPGMPKGKDASRRRRGIRLPIGALRAAEKELQGTANMIPRTFPLRRRDSRSLRLPFFKRSKPKTMSSNNEFAHPSSETFLPTLPTPPKRSKKRSPRAAQLGRAAACSLDIRLQVPRAAMEEVQKGRRLTRQQSQGAG